MAATVLYSSGAVEACRPVTLNQSLASQLQLICEFMINMAASLDPEDESSEGDNNDGDAAYVDMPVRSRLL